MKRLIGGLWLVGLFEVGAQAKPPGGWTCPDAQYDDDVCDCGCGADDADCTTSTFEGCERSACKAGQVPWEHAPASCMSSACGDGWRDEAAGEACDDGEALAGGGCAADCKSVNEGWVCGERAQKCEAAPVAEPVVEPGPEAEVAEDVAEPEEDAATGADTSVAEAVEVAKPADAEGGGCAAGGGAWWALGALAMLARRARG